MKHLLKILLNFIHVHQYLKIETYRMLKECYNNVLKINNKKKCRKMYTVVSKMIESA